MRRQSRYGAPGALVSLRYSERCVVSALASAVDQIQTFAAVQIEPLLELACAAIERDVFANDAERPDMAIGADLSVGMNDGARVNHRMRIK